MIWTNGPATHTRTYTQRTHTHTCTHCEMNLYTNAVFPTGHNISSNALTSFMRPDWREAWSMSTGKWGCGECYSFLPKSCCND